MTIKISIENEDATRTVVVTERSYDKRHGTMSEGNPFRLSPGSRRTFYCFHLRDLIISEEP